MNKTQLLSLLGKPLRIMPKDSTIFETMVEDEIMAPMPDLDKYTLAKSKLNCDKGVPLELAYLYVEPILSREQEYHLFRQMNYLKYQAKKILDTIDVNNIFAGAVSKGAKAERLLNQADTVSKLLVSCNTRLVMSVAKKTARDLSGGRPELMYEFLAEGTVAIVRCVGMFDWTLGNKFSTYATWAVLRQIGDCKSDHMKHTSYMPAEAGDLIFEQTERFPGDNYSYSTEMLMEHISPRERDIIERYYFKGQNLRIIGSELGITKERIRQIKVKSIRKMREAAECMWQIC